MKKVLTCFLILGSAALLMLSSCKKNDKEVTDAGSKAGTLTASSTTLVLDKTRVNDTTAAVMFNFTAPKITFKSATPSDLLQVDAVGDNWKNPSSIAVSSDASSQGFSTVTFDKLVLKLNLPVGQASQVNVRLSNGLSAETALYSNVVTLTVTPFNLISFIYVVGAFQGWNAGAPDSLVSATSNGVYTGIINYTAGNNQFLILPAKNYNNKYATSQTSIPTTTVTYNASNNLIAPATAGNYLVTFDLNAGTITFEAVNYYSAIGSSTPPLGNGYSVDNDLKYVNGNQDWELTVGMVEVGAFKIRQDHDWTWSWGVLAAPDGKTLTDNNGGNIPVNAVGTYKITFNIPVAPLSTANTPPVTATYTLTQQ